MQHLEVDEFLLYGIAQVDVLIKEQVFLEQERVVLLRLLLRSRTPDSINQSIIVCKFIREESVLIELDCNYCLQHYQLFHLLIISYDHRF